MSSRKNGSAETRPVTGDSLNAYIREIAKFKPLASEEEKELGGASRPETRTP